MNNKCRVLVFGGSGALGRAVCETLAAQGCRIVFTYAAGKTIADEIAQSLEGTRPLPVDLTSVASLEQVVDESVRILGGLDAFVHCAAVCVAPGEHVPADSNQRMEDVQESGWDLVLAVNTKSAFFGCRRVAEHLRKNSGGNIVLVGSIDVVKPLPAPVHYAASKGALVGMTLAMSKELGPANIRVNVIVPGMLEAGKARALPQHLYQEYVKHCSLKRVGRMAEIAATIAWFAQHNTYVTGQSIVVDGAL